MGPISGVRILEMGVGLVQSGFRVSMIRRVSISYLAAGQEIELSVID